MNLTEFRQALADNPAAAVRFIINDQAAIADHFHVTEVGCVEKRFVDCGGKPRVVVTCVLQTLVAHDVQHRLTTDKLAAIMKLVDPLDLPADAPVEVEHQERSVSIDAVAGCSVEEGTVLFRLAPKQTACLAEDACGLGPTTPSQTDGVQAEGSLPVLGGECCGGTSGCC